MKMKYRYDLHVHSALSPCADNEMTPVTIVGTAMLAGLSFVAIADHNSIKNVQTALAAGEAYGINVVPAMELQTSEDIHILCLFPTYEKLKGFYQSVTFSKRKNVPEIFGEQQIVDEDDNVVGYEDTMLLDSADISSTDVPELAAKFDGVAVPAHIDRDSNGMIAILGAIEDCYKTVEISSRASSEFVERWSQGRRVIIDSDAHTLVSISSKGEVELPECTVDALLNYIRN